jgi:hypothetical protein
MKLRIDNKYPTYVAIEASKRGPIRVEPAEGGVRTDKAVVAQPPVVAPADGRKAPPRLRKPSPDHDRCVAPTGDLETHRARLREAFGNTLSDEFVEVLLGKLMELLRPNPFDNLQEPTLNAALALIDSIQPRSEMEALIAVQIVATGLSGLRFLRQSQHQMDDSFIDIYGGYAIKLIKLQNELLQTLDRNRRGHKQSVQARDVHIHSGAQGVVGIINSGNDGRGGQDMRPSARSVAIALTHAGRPVHFTTVARWKRQGLLTIARSGDPRGMQGVRTPESAEPETVPEDPFAGLPPPVTPLEAKRVWDEQRRPSSRSVAQALIPNP